MIMDHLDLQVLKPTGGKTALSLSEGKAVEEIIQALVDGGYMVFKHATNLSKFTKKDDILSNRVRLHEDFVI